VRGGSHGRVGLPYFRHWSGVARMWKLGRSATIATLFHLRSVPPFCRPILSRTFPNELLSRTSSLSQTNSLHNHHHLITDRHHQPFIPLYSYSRQSPAMFVAMFCHYCCRRLQAPLPLVFGNNISFKFVSSHPHVFPKLHTYAHSGLPQRPNKQNGIRSPTAASRPAAVDTDHV